MVLFPGLTAGGGWNEGDSDSMSIDKSLKKGIGLTRARNVLSRAERLAVLQDEERWTPEKGVFNLPKTKFRRLAPGQSGPKRPEELQNQ
jgi:small basic protein (TIGR04137 family)